MDVDERARARARVRLGAPAQRQRRADVAAAGDGGAAVHAGQGRGAAVDLRRRRRAGAEGRIAAADGERGGRARPARVRQRRLLVDRLLRARHLARGDRLFLRVGRAGVYTLGMRFPIFVAAGLAVAPALAAGSDLDDLGRWAAGTWRCRSQAGDQAYTFTLAFSWQLDKQVGGARLAGRAARGGGARGGGRGRPGGGGQRSDTARGARGSEGDDEDRVRSVNVYGWDGNQLTSLFVNNQGARGMSTSPGWDGDRLVFSGTVDIAGYHTATTSTLTRRGRARLRRPRRTG